ncbi:uncharacterized protein LACBIDRAFT_325691 [Laccaria bicolor S238N-H82]|uniref:Predicted protein n=1 Tax=Laccaria bicolor (strain S238N-H82 / ATCC MYA-4686) TaxID=486041 RepID=B0D5W4_LACBS|nr:uncharacterized protein LACBIDRAFT_325691 [Laccaria bicolor S238N-H82]EDR10091.1 predicted protein [Laccaria bicolor S238N-H82]|eukprot:XP_001879476.1 predicted protein [Laccaria bicolor S238N-H82]
MSSSLPPSMKLEINPFFNIISYTELGMRQRSTDLTTTAWCGMLGAPVRTLVARSFPAPECAEISISRPSRTFTLYALLSRQILTAEGLYNSTPMIGSDWGKLVHLIAVIDYKQDIDVSSRGRLKITTTVTTPNGPTVQRAEMLPGTRSSPFKIDPIISEGSHCRLHIQRPELRRRVVLLSAERKKLVWQRETTQWNVDSNATTPPATKFSGWYNIWTPTKPSHLGLDWIEESQLLNLRPLRNVHGGKRRDHTNLPKRSPDEHPANTHKTGNNLPQTIPSLAVPFTAANKTRRTGKSTTLEPEDIHDEVNNWRDSQGIQCPAIPRRPPQSSRYESVLHVQVLEI